ncbi:thiamine-monophosphate kinase [alpha proteobacterium Q-1]|nr:thiamine-monophosphate kinase [alpha proteobacterium Q-1]
MDEFGLIKSCFAALAGAGAPAYGLGDDAAVLAPPAGCDLVFTKDMMVSGRHFFADDPADLVARKLLRVNLSDLAAMGARPLGYLLGFAFPDHLDEALARDFCRGLAQDQAEFGLRLYGGDTVSGAGSLILSLTAIGAVGQGRALRRKGAQPGDDVYVSGAIGEAALGLKALLGTLPPAVARIPDFAAIKDALINRYHLPRPRVALGMALAGHASAAIDISDGLLADLGHICEQSDCAMEIEAGQVPLSDGGRMAVHHAPELWMDILTGGDDYELAFTAATDEADQLAALAHEAGVAISRIGRVKPGAGLAVIAHDGTPLPRDAWGAGGFQHQ